MNQEHQQRKYLVHIRLYGNPNKYRIADAAKGVKSVLERIAGDNMQIAYTSPDGSMFAFAVKTEVDASIIRNHIKNGSPEGWGWHQKRYTTGGVQNLTSPILNGDECLVVEIGDDVAGVGFGRIVPWIQNR